MGYFGTLPGQFAVDADGGANYTVPIGVPPGTAGMTPQLALAYNSAAPNGMLGVGWSLLGLSAINRVGQTQAQDGELGAVTYTSADRFALDGQRLIGDYEDPNAVYRTELETWMSAVAHYGGGRTGPDAFTVRSKDGRTWEYAKTADAALPAGTEVRAWALSQVTDLCGNAMTVTYTPDVPNGVSYPARIDYTSNAAAGLVAGRAVTFTYESRPDVLTRFQGGYPVAFAQRMKT